MIITNHDIVIKVIKTRCKIYFRQFRTAIPEMNRELVEGILLFFYIGSKHYTKSEQKIPASYRNTKLTIFSEIKMQQK